MKKTVSLVLALIMAFSACAAGFGSMNKVSAIDFTCGENATWYLDTNSGVLSITGTGDVTSRPWSDYKAYVKSVEVSEGIKSLCDYAFSTCSKLKTVSLPSTLGLVGYAVFSGCDALTSVDFPNGSNLYYCTASGSPVTACSYFTAEEGPIYLGTLLCGYSGEMPENYTLNIKDGTLGIIYGAFRDQTNLTSVTAPDSLMAAGSYAFTGTSWLDSLDYGPVYLGKLFLMYNGNVTLEDMNFVIAEGTKGIAGKAFYSKELLTTLTMPDTVEFIGEWAFSMPGTLSNAANAAKLTSINVSKNTKYIGEDAFSGTTNNANKIAEIVIPASVEYLGKELFQFSPVQKVTFEEGFSLSYLPEYMFYRNWSVTDITIPESVKTLKRNAISWIYNLEKVIVPQTVTTIESGNFTNWAGRTTVIYCYYNSAAYNYAVENSLEYVLLDTADFSELTDLESAYKNLDRSLYTASSLFVLDAAAAKIDYTLGPDSQDEIDSIADEIRAAMEALEYLPADYSKVNEAVENAKNIDKSLYTYESQLSLYKVLSNINYKYTINYQNIVDAYVDEINAAVSSLNYVAADYSEVIKAIEKADGIDRSLCSEEYLDSLDKVIASVDYTITIDRQSEVDAYVMLIESAIENVSYKSADYTAVNDAVKKAEAVDRAYYSDKSLTVLDNMLEAVDYKLDIRSQSKVNAYAADINAAVAGLEYRDISIKNDASDIIVSATTKEINPKAKLSVDIVDPSEYEIANFSLWGSVKNINYYDINMIVADQKVQPDGAVKVKIGLPSSMNPAKCRIYHVTDDPVDPLVRYTSTLDGNYIVFETTHFSDFALIEIDTALESIEITSGTKTDYTVGDTVEKTDINVTANFTNGTSSTVSDFDISALDMSTPGTKTVNVYYSFGDNVKSASYQITVKEAPAVPETSIHIENLDKYNGKTLDYGAALKLTADVENSAGAEIEWYVNGQKYASGSSITLNNMTSQEYIIECRTTDRDGKTVSSETETVKVSTGFINMIIAFFKKLFGKTLTYNQ